MKQQFGIMNIRCKSGRIFRDYSTRFHGVKKGLDTGIY